jgi:3-methyl-2-oxobutanoate hydroxymethyltransferase
MKLVTVLGIQRKKQRGQRITMLTAYDHLFAGLVDQAGIDMILVGDSVGMVVQGRPTTLGVSLEEMIYHTRCATASPRRCLVVGDLPFGSYQVSVEQAVDSACRLMAEGGCRAVKLEGGKEFADRVAAIVRAGIPVVGHVGLTPQSIHRFGGYRLQGRSAESADEIMQGARALQHAGAFAVVLEKVHAAVAKRVTDALTIPTIGIGAGPHCDGQVLVLQDMLGLFEDFELRFVKRYARLSGVIESAIASYIEEVQNGSFPAIEHSYGLETDERPGSCSGTDEESVAGE